VATYRLDLTYEGTRFKGWARQPDQRTVQHEVERVLTTVLGEPARLRVAGRTDAGVHALAQVASFDSRAALDCRRLRLALNALLPEDVAVTAVSPAPDGFDARSATARTYRYRLWVSPVRPVAERLWVWNPRGAVDTDVLVATAPLLVGHRDFAALTPSAHLYRSCVRHVLRAEWRPAVCAAPVPAAAAASLANAGMAGVWEFEIMAGSFLHNMVRVAVGSMVDMAQGRMTVDQFRAALESGERRLMGQTAPARGLALVAVDYGR
jgi:tRNA pseudouridine38-40 synthase